MLTNIKILPLLILILTIISITTQEIIAQQNHQETINLAIQPHTLFTSSSDEADNNIEDDIDEDKNHNEQEQTEDQIHHLRPGDSGFWFYVTLACICTIVGAFCSGMTVGLLSISTLELEMMTRKTNQNQKKMAKMILSVVSNHHLFLVTLLIANAMALQSLPLVVHTLMPDWAAILFSTFIVLVVAEIIPQAYCTGPKKITLAYYASPIILVMIKIFWVLSYPIGKGLDYLLGVHEHERIQHKDFAIFLSDDKTLKETEKILLTSTLELRTQRVEDIMIPTKQFYMLEEQQIITESIAKEINEKDYSYILIYKQKKNKIVGLLKVKEFAVRYLRQKRDWRAAQSMKANQSLLSVYSDTNLLQMLMLFQAKSTRIALVCNKKRKIDPNIQSIMYSKSDMILNNNKEAEIVGVVFLYQLFAEMAKFKDQIYLERSSRAISQLRVEGPEVEMHTLNKPLVNH